ncbi:MAG: trypsin-like peptidase domain-containing protein [bacterium]|nr:trypsin-like peptidase domain-containing protein [bacterium]
MSRCFGTLFACLLFGLVLFPGPGGVSAQAEGPVLKDLQNTQEAFVRISKSVTPSVVNIRTFRKFSRNYSFNDRLFGDMFEPFQEFFGRDFSRRFSGPGDEKTVQVGLGSGVIVRGEGIVLTNNHVIEGADEIRVTLDDRSETTATVVGSDPRTDIAVLRLPKGRYAAAPLADSDAIEVGQWAVAIGNPFGLGQSVTVGVVSAKGRADVGIADFEDFIQTDAAINPGNSGGPLIDLNGRVIGINTAIFSRSGGYQGIGFAIPTNMAVTVMDSLLRTGRIVRSDLGIRVQDATPEIIRAMGASVKAGVVVTEVLAEDARKGAGLKRGDIITKVKGRDVRDTGSFYRMTSVLRVGEVVPLVAVRDGIPNTFMVTVGKLPERPKESGDRLRTALGFSVEVLTEKLAEELGYRYERGVLITRVTRASQADRAGIEPGDLILRVNGKDTPDLKAFRSAFEAVDWGDEVILELGRGGKKMKVGMLLKQ